MTAGTSSLLLSWAGDRLTAIRNSAGQFAASLQAVLSAHSPRGTITPVSSASGMKSAGEIKPRVG